MYVFICSRLAQICDCCRWFGQQHHQDDEESSCQSNDASSLRSMVCLLTSHHINSSDITIRTKEVIAAAIQQGLSLIGCYGLPVANEGLNSHLNDLSPVRQLTPVLTV